MTRNSYIAHHGILGQRWGVRRYQNEDGSLTPAGAERYRKNTAKKLSVEHPNSGETYTNLKNKFVSQNAELSLRYEDNSEQIKTLMADYNQEHYGALFGIARSIKEGDTKLSNVANKMYFHAVEDGDGSAAAYLIATGKERQASRLYKEYRELSAELTSIGREYIDDVLGRFKDTAMNKRINSRRTVGEAVLDKLVDESDGVWKFGYAVSDLKYFNSGGGHTPSRSDILKAKKFIENFTVPLTSKTIAELYTLEEQYDWDMRDVMAFSKKDWEFVNDVLRKA